MRIASLLNGRWDELALAVMPGAELQSLARARRAIVRSRKLGQAQQLLRLAWLYGPGGMSLRTAAGWASGSGLAELSDVAVLKALRRMADWMEALVGAALASRLAYAVDCGADYLIRTGWRSLAWRDADGSRLNLLGRLEHLRPGEIADLRVQVAVKERTLTTRLIVLARDEEATAKAERNVRLKAQKNCRPGDPRSMTAARYLMVVTSLDAEQYPARKVLALYRMRWQIELAFKRLKSLLRFDRLPAKDKDLARTWLNSHLLLALVLDKLTQQALDSPPCAPRNARAAAPYLARPAFAQNRSPRHRPARR